jgi:hypothetical protein
MGLVRRIRVKENKLLPFLAPVNQFNPSLVLSCGLRNMLQLGSINSWEIRES